MIKLEVLNTAFKGKRFSFKDGVTLGSGPQAVIRAQHPEMQDVHARFYSEAGRAMIEAVGDKARIYINGKDVMRTHLRHNDELQVGPLRFKVLDGNMMSSNSLRIDELMEEMEKKDDDEVLDFAKEDLFYLTTKDPTLRERIAFSVPSKDRFIDQAQVFLARLVKQCGMVEEQVEAFMTCAKELILNAHRHGHKYDESKTVTIRYRDFGDRIQVSIEDQGPGFDHKGLIGAVRAKDAATAARERYQAGGFGGLGFQLITRMASELTYNDAGNRVTFVIGKKPKE
jgi:serine/threonine-protein kinase RsbW